MSTGADVVLAIHAAFVLFVVGGLAVFAWGATRNRPWAFNPWLRGLHLAAIAFVVVESLLGYACPLTLWEDALRGVSTERGFIARAIHAWLFWSAPPWVFTTIYCAFGALVALSWWKWPPRRGGARR